MNSFDNNLLKTFVISNFQHIICVFLIEDKPNNFHKFQIFLISLKLYQLTARFFQHPLYNVPINFIYLLVK